MGVLIVADLPSVRVRATSAVGQTWLDKRIDPLYLRAGPTVRSLARRMKICSMYRIRGEIFLIVRGSYIVGHRSTPRSQRFFWSLGCVLRGLMLDLGVNLSAQQDRNASEPEPHHQSNTSS